FGPHDYSLDGNLSHRHVVAVECRESYGQFQGRADLDTGRHTKVQSARTHILQHSSHFKSAAVRSDAVCLRLKRLVDSRIGSPLTRLGGIGSVVRDQHVRVCSTSREIDATPKLRSRFMTMADYPSCKAGRIVDADLFFWLD